jgi:hypothetical protein
VNEITLISCCNCLAEFVKHAPVSFPFFSGRYYLSGAIDNNGLMWLWGGTSSSSYNDVWSFDPVILHWTFRAGTFTKKSLPAYSAGLQTEISGATAPAGGRAGAVW